MALSRNRPPLSFLPVVTRAAECPEVARVERLAGLAERSDVVNLELFARAARGAAVPVPLEGGCTCALPFRRGADEHSGFACGAALAWPLPLAPSTWAPVALGRGSTVSPHDGHNRRTVISCRFGLRGNRHYFGRGSRHTPSPPGCIGQPPACQLSSAASAPSFLVRDGGAVRGCTSSLLG